jgi:hypothetical protein
VGHQHLEVDVVLDYQQHLGIALGELLARTIYGDDPILDMFELFTQRQTSEFGRGHLQNVLVEANLVRNIGFPKGNLIVCFLWPEDECNHLPPAHIYFLDQHLLKEFFQFDMIRLFNNL